MEKQSYSGSSSCAAGTFIFQGRETDNRHANKQNKKILNNPKPGCYFSVLHCYGALVVNGRLQPSDWLISVPYLLSNILKSGKSVSCPLVCLVIILKNHKSSLHQPKLLPATKAQPKLIPSLQNAFSQCSIPLTASFSKHYYLFYSLFFSWIGRSPGQKKVVDWLGFFFSLLIICQNFCYDAEHMYPINMLLNQ